MINHVKKEKPSKDQGYTCVCVCVLKAVVVVSNNLKAKLIMMYQKHVPFDVFVEAPGELIWLRQGTLEYDMIHM